MSIYAVNSKEPIAAWIPSLDTAGNGTTTLTDLVGSTNGTLTNFALTGSTSNWVADTTAGGVRCLDSDGTNDRVALGNPSSLNLTTVGGVSAWFLSENINHAIIIQKCDYNTDRNGWSLVSRSTVRLLLANTSTTQSLTAAYSQNTWTHVIGTWDASNMYLYVNGSLAASAARTVTPTPSGSSATICGETDWGGAYRNGRVDDMRVFSVLLDSTDAAYLWNSGAGRGRVSVSPDARRRRQSVFGGVL